MTQQRVAFIHSGAVNIPTFQALAEQYLESWEVMHLLDDRLVADPHHPERAASVPSRLLHLAYAAADAGAQAAMITCSSVGSHAANLSSKTGISVLRVDEAMADEAVLASTHNAKSRIAVIATVPTTVEPTVELLRQRAELKGRHLDLSTEIVPGAFDAVNAGNRELHDELVVAAIQQAAPTHDLIVLAQATMAAAARGIDVGVPVLTSAESGVQRLAHFLLEHQQ